MGKTEEWRAVKGYEGLYEVSNKGNVRRLSREIVRDIGNYIIPSRMLTLFVDGHGYLCVNLTKNKEHCFAKVHRLVADAFIENPHKKPEVNHKDCNPQNNYVDNLEWCTHYENMRYMHEQGRAVRTKEWLERMREANKSNFKPVIATNLSTGETIIFGNLNKVRECGFHPSCVCNCCKGKRGATQHKGYRFEYLEME